MALINEVPVVFWACMLADVAGFLIGTVIWYGPQLLRAPWWAWPFIPDCPLAALFGMIAFIRLRQGAAPDWLTALASLSCIKYGIWTILFWGTKWLATGEVLPVEIALVVVHLAMAGQGLLLWPALLEVPLSMRFVAIAWLALAVFVDYTFGHHPMLAVGVSPMLAGSWAAGLTLLLALAMWLLQVRPTLAGAMAQPS
jgi:uncharacterized membrane protein YpjA